VLTSRGKWPESISLGSASPGGVYYVYRGAVAELLTEWLGIRVNHYGTIGVYNFMIARDDYQMTWFGT
jgi:TRAP-type uncharacterized transport system substrate-binding protein